MRDQRVLLGIIGGMGTAASARMVERLMALAPAARDDEHLEFILHNNSRVPDRTAAIEGRGPSPLPQLQRSLDLLAAAGAGVVAVPCMSSHWFLAQLVTPPEVNLLDGIRETAAWCRREHPRVATVGLLATTGAVASGVYQDACAEQGLAVLLPEADEQAAVMEAIYGDRGIKAGFTTGPARDPLLAVAARLVARGAEAVIAGCTEVPLVMGPDDVPVPLLDTIDILCLAAIRECVR